MKQLFTVLCATVLVASAIAAPVTADEQKPVYIEHQQRPDGGIDVWAVNSLQGDATVDLELTLSGLTPTHYLRTGVVKRRDVLLMARLSRTGGRYTWRYRYYYQTGNKHARHRDVVYLLPYAPDVSAMLNQGYFGSFSHQKSHALDFGLPIGSTIRAARGGRVVATEDRYTEGGIGPQYRNKANYVKIQHDDGTLGAYYHLSPGGILVTPGQTVKAGDEIGLSGHTGHAKTPHLHFEVTVPVDGRNTRTVPTRFKTVAGLTNGADLKQGRSYMAQ